MSDGPTNRELAIKIDNLGKAVEDGFKRVDESIKDVHKVVGLNTQSRLEDRHVPKIVYAMVGFILVSVGGAIIKLVV